MECNDRFNCNFEDFPSSMANTPGCYASSQKFIDPTTEYNDLDLLSHPASSINHYPPVATTINNDGHVALSASSSNKIYAPQFHGVSSNMTPDWHGTNVAEYSEDSWINSDITLRYINKLLMEEDSDDKFKPHHGESALRAMEEPLYRLIGQNYPANTQLLPLCSSDHMKTLDGSISNGQPCSSFSVAISSGNNRYNDDLQAFEAPWSLSAIVGETRQFTQDTYTMELGLNVGGLSIVEKTSRDNQSLQINDRESRKHALFEVQCQKMNSCKEDFDLLEGRSNKQFATSFNEPTRNEIFDKVLLCSDHELIDQGIILQEAMASKSTINSQTDQGRTSAQRKKKGKKQQRKEVVDLRTLLIHCAEAVSVNNHTLANDILSIIRQHASTSGDDSQRLAFCLADCLEVRLAGTGSQLYRNLMAKRTSALGTLKVFHLCIAICPFLRAPYYFSNKTITDVSKGKPRVHIIDFGICFGFQWPSLFEQLAKREGGPPKVRITGIEQPQPGFRPNESSMNAGHRLADYASMFNIPFEYQGISSKWETIKIEDFNIDKDDVLIVNCIYRLKNLGDETVSIDSARNRVLNTIRMMKPKVFIHGVVNGSYSTPFFLTRFKEVMYHYSALFDLLDKTVPRDYEARMILERDIYLSVVLNVIACEGSERIERPESYKKWKLRNQKAGFEQLPLNPDTVKGTRAIVRQYHKDYIVNEDDQWLLMGWKGRILYGIATWKTSESYNGD
ncbi:hypothetical protein SETIT_9G174600v2 [Setaria italica]|uniref:Uncharacterized protein n=3 Tax=Setaria italica TaxID=4555 RepID=A0A368SHT6_SETIT|nr:hypothetical protein SETIT_9G174600v2 [Setaria italica]